MLYLDHNKLLRSRNLFAMHFFLSLSPRFPYVDFVIVIALLLGRYQAFNREQKAAFKNIYEIEAAVLGDMKSPSRSDL